RVGLTGAGPGSFSENLQGRRPDSTVGAPSTGRGVERSLRRALIWKRCETNRPKSNGSRVSGNAGSRLAGEADERRAIDRRGRPDDGFRPPFGEGGRAAFVRPAALDVGLPCPLRRL